MRLYLFIKIDFEQTLVLDKNTWYHITIYLNQDKLLEAIIVYKWLLILVTWNHITAWNNKLFVLRIMTWSDNCLQLKMIGSSSCSKPYYSFKH